MTDKRIYTVGIPEDAQTRDEQTNPTDISKLGVVSGTQPIAEQVRSDPDDVLLEGEFRGRYSRLMASELNDLFGNSTIDHAPFMKVDNDGKRVPFDEAGYYALESARIEKADPRDDTDSHFQFRLNMVHKGTLNDFWRGIDFAEQQLDHEFGNDDVALLSAPEAADHVFWWDKTTGDRQKATPTETVSAKYGDVERYDVSDVSEFDDPRLLYSLDMEQEGRVDVELWDDRETETKLDSDGIPQWQQVFSTSHEDEGAFVASTGRLRVHFDDSARAITAEEWDPAVGEWVSIGLSDPSDVDLFDVDWTFIGMAQLQCQLTFETDTALFTLDCTLNRGADSVVFDIPQNETGPIPDPLESWLDPIASESLVDVNASKTLVSRNNVKR